MVRKREHAWSYVTWVCDLKSMEGAETTECPKPTPDCRKCDYREKLKKGGFFERHSEEKIPSKLELNI